MKRMLVICPYPQGIAAGQRLKYEQYFSDWRARGWEIEVSSFMDRAMWDVVWEKGQVLAKVRGVLRGTARRIKDLLRLHRYDLVYVFMWVTPFGTSLFERVARAGAKRLIFDIEDNVLSQQPGGTADHIGPLIRMLKNPGKAKYLIRTADHVITTTDHFNALCLDLNRNRACSVIPSSVDTDRFQPATPYSNEKTVVIGWTGTFSSRVYLDLLRGVFQRLAKRVPFRLRVCPAGGRDRPDPSRHRLVRSRQAAAHLGLPGCSAGLPFDCYHCVSAIRLCPDHPLPRPGDSLRGHRHRSIYLRAAAQAGNLRGRLSGRRI